MAWLTKSRFMSGRQCPKRLWFEVNEPLEDKPRDALPLINGRKLDDAVRTMKPGTVISRERGMPSAIAETTRVMGAGSTPILYQPAFRFGDLAVIADILRREKHEFSLVEVKASTQVKDVHIPDAAFQALVLRGVRIPVSRVFIAHVDNQFVLERAGDYNGLLTEVDVTDGVEPILPEVADMARALQGVMASTRVPTIEMGPQCSNPYDCPFIPRCSKERGPAPEYPVDLLPRSGKTVEALVAAGYSDLRNVPAARITGDVQRRVHSATVSGEPYFDATATEDLRALKFPRAYLDFETISYAVPEIVGTRPYEQLPFQWSMHIEDSPAKTWHVEYLAIESFGNFAELAQALLNAVPAAGPIFVYNATFERGVLERLADRLPGQSQALLNLAERLVDLWPITKDAYYHRDMKGSWSIKAVLPTIAPELDYDELEDVQEGSAAQLAFVELRGAALRAERREQLIQALREYCRRDTWGMVVLRRFLCGENLSA
jgi:hypothetical protein